MSIELVVELIAAGLAVWAAVLSLPRPVALDWERLFKVSLTAMLWGETEAAGGSADDLEAKVAALVPYHPAGRLPEQKLTAPDPAALPTPALPGELGLVEALAALPDPAARWPRLYATSDQSKDALLSHPDDLGTAYRAQAFFGAEATWEGISVWDAAITAGMQRRLAHIVVAGFGGPLGEAMAAAAGLRGGAATLEGVAAMVEQPSDRLVIVIEGDGALAVVQHLHATPALRDLVVAIVSVGSDLCGSEEAAAWMAEHFSHAELDTELNRQTAYMAAAVVDPAGLGDAPDWSGQRWPQPAESALGRTPIVPMDLGPIPPEWLAGQERRAQLAQALWVVVAAWLS